MFMSSSFVKDNVIHFQRGVKDWMQSLRYIKRAEVFAGLKSTSQSCDHPLIVSGVKLVKFWPSKQCKKHFFKRMSYVPQHLVNNLKT